MSLKVELQLTLKWTLASAAYNLKRPLGWWERPERQAERDGER